VGTGVLVASVLFARRVAHVVEVRADRDADTAVYRVHGQLFFASVTDLLAAFDVAGDPPRVEIDLSAAHVWDASTVAALDALTARYAARGTTVTITGMNAQSASRHAALAGHLTPG
jgi:sulfate permease, SulP family